MTIKVYSTPTCPYCRMAEDFLTEKKIEFEDLDVSENDQARDEMIEKTGQMGVPVLDVNGKIIGGFDKDRIEEAIGKEGQEKKLLNIHITYQEK